MGILILAYGLHCLFSWCEKAVIAESGNTLEAIQKYYSLRWQCWGVLLMFSFIVMMVVWFAYLPGAIKETLDR